MDGQEFYAAEAVDEGRDKMMPVQPPMNNQVQPHVFIDLDPSKMCNYEGCKYPGVYTCGARWCCKERGCQKKFCAEHMKK